MLPKHDNRSNRQHSWTIPVSIAVAVMFLWLALQGIDWETFWIAIRYGHYQILFLTLPMGSLSYLVRALRWSVFIRSEKNISIRSIFWANMVGYLGNAYLPARAGEFLRSGFLGQKSGLGTSFVLATALIERVLDTLALVLIGSVCLLLQANISPWLADAIRVMALVGVVGLAAILVVPSQEQLLLNILNRLPVPPNLSRRISEQISRFLVGMRSLQDTRRFLMFAGLTALIWLIDGIGTTIGVQIISQSLDLGQALILLSALGLSSAIPSTPGYVGVYQFVFVTVLTVFGFSRSEALAFSLINQALSYLTVTFWGLLGLWRISKMSNSQVISERMGR